MVQNQTTMDWDDYRIFLTVARAPSVRAAAAKLGVSHSTVLRHLNQLEKKLETRLFERNTVGFKPTDAGKEVLIGAQEIEESVQSIDRGVSGRDSVLSGLVSISMPDALVYYDRVLDIVAFKKRFPGIQLKVDLSSDPVDLKKREADIAVRCTDTPQEDLVGRRVGTLYGAAYATQSYIDKYQPTDPDSTAELIGYDSPETWQPPEGFQHLSTAGYFNDSQMRVSMTKAGFGVGILPVIIGEKESSLVRIGKPFFSVGVWVLYHADLRHTSRIRVVRDLLVETLSHRFKDPLS